MRLWLSWLTAEPLFRRRNAGFENEEIAFARAPLLRTPRTSLELNPTTTVLVSPSLKHSHHKHAQAHSERRLHR